MRSYYPVALDLYGKDVLLVGGGAIAEGKLYGLLEAGALVRLVAPDVTERLRSLAAAGRFRWHARAFDPADAAGAWIVIAASGDRSAVADAARAAGCLVNAVDDVPNCDFIAMSIVRRGDLQVAVSTGGGSPAMARWMREYLDETLPHELGTILAALADVRTKRKSRGAIPPYADWKRAIDEALSRAPACPAGEDPRSGAADPSPARPAGEATSQGVVALVGAGPGDPGLLTLRARDRLAAADVVVHDHLVGDGVLALARPDARCIYVGKHAGQHAMPQDEINRLLVALARQGRRVVRLKGGDPFVFGRGGEEALALRAASVPFEVVPGVSAALAAPAAVGIPVTHRGVASAVTVVTGHECGGSSGVDWTSLARSGATLVVLMGIGNLGAIADRLVAAGRPPDEPVALVERATHADERVLRCTLATAAHEARAAGVAAPAVIVVGAVAALHDLLGSHDHQPGRQPAMLVQQ